MKKTIMTLILASAGTSLALAQRPGDNDQEAGRRVNRQFAQNAPNIGDSLPNLTVFRADGKPLSLSSLRGSDTVLIFGCLT